MLLWADDDDALPNSIALVDGEAHFVPPMEQRAELARKWLFIRATYNGIQPPSKAQREHANEIVALAMISPIHPAQWRANAEYRERFNWANPLLEENADRWYDDQVWRRQVFRSVQFLT